MKTHLHFEDVSPAQVAAIMAAAHGAGAAAPQTNVALPPAGAAPPPPAAPAAPPPAPVAPAAPPPPPAPVPAASTPGSDPALTAKMQQHVQTHKAASLKHVLAKMGLTKVTDANAEQAAWLHQFFDSGVSGPQAWP
jgi:hypothetical protein